MRKLSVKVKITGWYLLLMTIMAGLLLAFLVAVSGSVSTQTAMDQLEQTVRANLRQVDMADGSLQFGENFLFYDNGVYTLIYSQSEALLAGQVPVGFTASEPFQNGLTPAGGRGRRPVLHPGLLGPSGLGQRGMGPGRPGAPRIPADHQSSLYRHDRPAPVHSPGGGGRLRHRPAGFPPPGPDHRTAAAIGEAADLSRRVEVPRGTTSSPGWPGPSTRCLSGWSGPSRRSSSFTADASHELRTPVSVIKSACEYAEKYGETPEEREETMGHDPPPWRTGCPCSLSSSCASPGWTRGRGSASRKMWT